MARSRHVELPEPDWNAAIEFFGIDGLLRQVGEDRLGRGLDVTRMSEEVREDLLRRLHEARSHQGEVKKANRSRKKST